MGTFFDFFFSVRRGQEEAEDRGVAAYQGPCGPLQEYGRCAWY